MSAGSTGQDSRSGDSDLRAQYLPISRKELRRRREAGLDTSPEALAAEFPAVTAQVKRIHPDERVSRVQAGDPVETDEQGTADEPVESGDPAEPDERSGREADSAEAAADDDAAGGDAAGDDADQGDGELSSTDPADDDAAVSEPWAGVVASAEPEMTTASAEASPEPETTTASAEASPEPEIDAEEPSALAALEKETLAELKAITREAAAQKDHTVVDPDLLKRQQALAAKAMQANQQRREREREQAEQQERRRRHIERPESEIITRKALRSYVDADDESFRENHTGSIEPVRARGAHGLELDELIEYSAAQAKRRTTTLWLVIVLAIVLAAVVSVLLITIF